MQNSVVCIKQNVQKYFQNSPNLLYLVYKVDHSSTKIPSLRVATFQTIWNSLTFPWLFQTKIKLYRDSEII